MVRRRDEYVVRGAIERNTGSSLYSRDTMIHMSMPVRVMSCGSTVSKRFWIQLLTSGACSRCVSTRTAGSGYVGDCAETLIVSRTPTRHPQKRTVCLNMGGSLIRGRAEMHPRKGGNAEAVTPSAAARHGAPPL